MQYTGSGSSNAMYFFYDETGSVAGFAYNGHYYQYLKNAQGDILGLAQLAADGYHVVVKYSYDSWGKLLRMEDGEGNVITSTAHIGYLNPFRYESTKGA